MNDEPDSLPLPMLRRLDEKLDRVLAEVSDVKLRLTSLERQSAETEVMVAGVSSRIDRVDARLERRLDLVEAH